MLRFSLHMLLLSGLFCFPVYALDADNWPGEQVFAYTLLIVAGVAWSFFRNGGGRLPPYRFSFPRRRAPAARRAAAAWSHYRKVQ